MASREQCDRFIEVGGQAERSREIVAGAERDQSQADSRTILTDPVDDLVQGSIAARGHDHLTALPERRPGESRAVALSGRQAHLDIG